MSTWDEIVEEMWRDEREEMERTRPARVQVMSEVFDGIRPGTLFNPHAHSEMSVFDMTDVAQSKPNQEVNKVSTIKYEDITIGLPLYGLRVMINPERFGDYPSELHGLSGNILNVQGREGSIKNVIRDYKNNGKYEGSWKVVVKFDNGKSLTGMRVRDLLPIASGHQNVYHFYTRDNEMYILEKDKEEFLNKQLIEKGHSVSLNRMYDEEYCRKIFDKA